MHSKIHHILKKKKLIKSIKTKFIWLHSSPVHHKLIAKNIYIYIIYVNNNLNKNENFFLDSTCVCLVLVFIIGFLGGCLASERFTGSIQTPWHRLQWSLHISTCSPEIQQHCMRRIVTYFEYKYIMHLMFFSIQIFK